MNVFLKNVGIVKETEKAYLLTFWQGGFKDVKWVPKSQIYITNQKETRDFYYTYYYPTRTPKVWSYSNCDNMFAKKNWYSKKCDLEVKNWFYKKELKGCY